VHEDQILGFPNKALYASQLEFSGDCLDGIFDGLKLLVLAGSEALTAGTGSPF